VWPGANAALAQGRSAGKLIGAYHFAGASGQPVGDPTAEADYFLAHYAWRPGEVPILDWEPQKPPADPDTWVATWLARVQSRLGVTPMVYMNHYGAVSQSKWTKTRALGPGLWSAWYGADTGQPLPGEPSFAPWTEAMWQYTSRGTKPGVSYPLDLSSFYGTAAQWRAFGTPATGDTFMGITFNSIGEFQDAVARAVLCYVPADRQTGADGQPSAWLWDKVEYVRSQMAGPLSEFEGRSLVQALKHVSDEEILPAVQALAADVAKLQTAAGPAVDPVAFANALAGNEAAMQVFAAALAPVLAKALGTNLANG
jgi:hypothetical protein